MHKIIRVVAATAGLALLTTACGGGGATSAGGATATDTASTSTSASPTPSESGAPVRGNADLVIWTDNLKVAAVKKVADEFAKVNGITAQTQVISGDLQAAFITANTAGNGPDVVVGAHDWIGNMVQNGAIDPLQLTPEQLGGYSKQSVAATTYDAQLYGLPYGVEAVALYRNTGIVPKAPATLDEAFDQGRAAVKAGKVQSALNLQQGELGDAYHMQALYTSLGGYVFKRGANGTFDPKQLGVGGEGSIKAAQRIAKLGEKGDGILRRSISGDNSIALFSEGKAAFLISGPWALNDIKKSKVKYAISPIPGFKGAGPAIPFGGVQAFFVASKGKNKTFAQEFVTNGANSETSMRTMYDGAQLPPAMTAVRDAVKGDQPDAEMFAQAFEAADPMPAIPQMAAVFAPLGKAYAAIIGGADPVKTMQSVGKTLSSELSG